MELTEELFNEIHAYLEGEGSEEKRADFEKRMSQQPELAEEVALQRRIKTGLKAIQYRQQFKEIHNQLAAEGKLPDFASVEVEEPTYRKIAAPERRIRPLWQYIAVAAAIVLAVGLVWYMNHDATPIDKQVAGEDGQTQQENPVEQQPETPKNETPVLPPPPNLDQLVAEAFSPKVTLGRPFSEENLGVSPALIMRWEADTTALYTGIRQLQAGRAAAAETEFNKITESRTTEIAQHAQWYLALAQLKQAKLAPARQQLQTIAGQTSHIHQAQAQQLLAKLSP